MEKTYKYHVMVKGSPMEIVGVPMWRGVYFDTEAEANAAVEKARAEINRTWADPKNVPVWIERVDASRIAKGGPQCMSI